MKGWGGGKRRRKGRERGERKVERVKRVWRVRVLEEKGEERREVGRE